MLPHVYLYLSGEGSGTAIFDFQAFVETASQNDVGFHITAITDNAQGESRL